MADKLPRFITGKINRCRLVAPGGPYKQYSLHIEGMFEDTHDSYDGFLNSKYPVSVYEGDNDPIDPSNTDNLVFNGRVYVLQDEKQNGDPIYYLKAVSIEERIGAEESSPSIPEGNPFLKNPLV